ncbi:MAG: hypothetical protein GX166_01400 [Clostridiaceae bacterium]|jgi:hypothetical protein|nr:hypothetical protein [Clostridiaceae bacterium]
MKLHFLGTGAADWDINSPSDSINFRRFSSMLVDDCLLIDPGPCIFEFAETFKMPNLFANLKDVICTHKHADHFNQDNLNRLLDECANAEFHEIDAFDKLETDKHVIYAYPANHGTAISPKHYVVENKEDGKRVFYGLDGAWLLCDVYKALLEFGKIDLMVFDATIGNIEGDYRIFEHNNLAMIKEMCKTFQKICSNFIISHMARTLHAPHEELVKDMERNGIMVAHDNLIIKL